LTGSACEPACGTPRGLFAVVEGLPWTTTEIRLLVLNSRFDPIRLSLCCATISNLIAIIAIASLSCVMMPFAAGVRPVTSFHQPFEQE
jgi:hypothetical protein